MTLLHSSINKIKLIKRILLVKAESFKCIASWKNHLTMKTPTKTKYRYKVTNWKEYNQSLCNRGSLTLWIDEDIASGWYEEGIKQAGGNNTYSDMAIELCLSIRSLHKFGYRQTEGYMASLFSLAKIDLAVPCYTQLQRRSKELSIAIKTRIGQKEKIDIVIDSTGLKVYGEGEWKVRIHGKDKNRTWRKVHIASDPSDLEIIWVKITGNDVHDAAAAIDMPSEVAEHIVSCAGDGAYDKKKFRKCLPGHIKQLIPPQKNAVTSKDDDPVLKQRDIAIKRIKKVGRKKWKEDIGYHKRSLSEVNMYRFKQTFGPNLKARKPEYEVTEVRIKCKILNKFVDLGMPVSIRKAA